MLLCGFWPGPDLYSLCKSFNRPILPLDGEQDKYSLGLQLLCGDVAVQPQGYTFGLLATNNVTLGGRDIGEW